MSIQEDRRHATMDKDSTDIVSEQLNIDALPEPGTEERRIAERRLVRKLDMRVLPTIILIYILNHIDRTGVTTARLKGMQKDLGITDVQYATVIAVLFVSYCPAQIPSNVILNWISRPSLYIGICGVLWGLTSALTGITRNFAGITVCRVFIGLPEAAFYPGSIYLLSRWYTKKELSFRSAILYIGSLTSNAFGALLAAGILTRMDGKRGIRAWRWLFFIEGAITIFVSLNSMWLLPDYPHNTRWISPMERRLAQARLADDVGEADRDNIEDSPLAGLKMAITDSKVQLFALMSLSQLLGLSFVQYFPTLTATFGYNTTISLLLAAPPWILASVVCCLNAWNADRTGDRFSHITAPMWGVVIGFIVALSTSSFGGRYASLFLMACGYAGQWHIEPQQ
ncbi:hypothetical protein AX15_005937 [Amanita polypyramis BW_CC]|nr:hypothetical protein AX15_005937 [Amanita polypyramis BW_CC]